jgi:uncharacterized protein YycO
MVNQRLELILKKTVLVAVVFIAIAIGVVLILDYIVDKDRIWKPDYLKTDLDHIIIKETLSKEDYDEVFKQTGLGRLAIDRLRLDNDEASEVKAVLKKYQENFFKPITVKCRKIGWITFEENIVALEKKNIEAFQIANLRKGDVFITKSTHSIGWRHGHAAIVVDEEKKMTLESTLWGHDSTIQGVDKWRTYPSFMLLRLKNDDDGYKAAEIADYAREHMAGVPYGLLAGFPIKAPIPIKKTHCSHLVWYPFYIHGYDIDSNGTWLVTPKDIANSDLFEVVQVYGVNPLEIW